MSVHFDGSTKAHQDLPATPQEIIEALDALKLDRDRQMAITFSEIFPAIAAAKARGHSDQEIRALLEKMGVKLHHAKFRKLYRAELRARQGSEETINSKTSSQPLHAMDQADTKELGISDGAADSGAEVGS